MVNLLGGRSKGGNSTLRFETGEPVWVLDPPDDFPSLLRGLSSWLDPGDMLYVESSVTDAELLTLLSRVAVPGTTRIARGTLWPRPQIFHIPATGNLAAIAGLMEQRGFLELADHLHAYKDDRLLLQWFDAFSGEPILLSGSYPIEKVQALADSLDKTFRRGR